MGLVIKMLPGGTKPFWKLRRAGLKGPFNESACVAAVVSRRFPLQQGQKLRPIDDYSMSQVNADLSTKDQATADNVDVVCAMLLSYAEFSYVAVYNPYADRADVFKQILPAFWSSCSCKCLYSLLQMHTVSSCKVPITTFYGNQKQPLKLFGCLGYGPLGTYSDI